MACQLHEQGCTVGLVAMLDPPDPPDFAEWHEKIGSYGRKFYYYVKHGRLFPALMDFIFHRRLYKVQNKIVLLYNRLFPRTNSRLDDVLQENIVLNAHTTAMETYVPKFYPGKITIFANSEAQTMEQEEEAFHPEKEWSDFATKVDKHVIEGEGGHLGLFEEPLFPQLVGKLKKSLIKAQAEQDSSQIIEKK
jgi:thioesterase domain-containing protein